MWYMIYDILIYDGSFDITPLLLHYQSQLPQIGRTPLRYWTNEIQSPHSNFATTKKSSIANDKEIFHPPSQRYATKKQTKCQVLWNTLQEYLCILFLFVFAKLTSKPGLGRCTFAVYSVIWKQIKLGLKLDRQRDKSPFNVALVYVALIWSRNSTLSENHLKTVYLVTNRASYFPSSFFGEPCSCALASSAFTWKAIFLVHHVN